MPQPKVTSVQRISVKDEHAIDQLQISFSETGPLRAPLTLYPFIITYNEKNEIASIGLQNMCQPLLNAGEWQVSDGLRIRTDLKNDTLRLSLLDHFNLKEDMKMTCIRNVYVLHSKSGHVGAIHIQDASATVACESNGEDDIEKEFRLMTIE